MIFDSLPVVFWAHLHGKSTCRDSFSTASPGRAPGVSGENLVRKVDVDFDGGDVEGEEVAHDLLALDRDGERGSQNPPIVT